MLGIAFSTKANFGLSMIAAGPYILHVWLRDTFAWFTQGTAEYFYEALFLLILCIVVKEFKLKFLLTFAEAFFSGLIIDGWFFLLGGNGPYGTLQMRIVSYVLGLAICTLGVAFFFRTDLPLQVYDFAVVKIADVYHFEQRKVKQVIDIIMFMVSLMFSLLLTHKLTGIGIGTVLTTILNSTIINLWGKLIDRAENNNA